MQSGSTHSIYSVIRVLVDWVLEIQISRICSSVTLTMEDPECVPVGFTKGAISPARQPAPLAMLSMLFLSMCLHEEVNSTCRHRVFF
jgi:hypothetical protein